MENGSLAAASKENGTPGQARGDGAFWDVVGRTEKAESGWVAVVADCAAICKFGDMGKQPALEISQAFLDVLWADPPPCDQILAAALDRLIAATHDVAEVDGSADFEPSPENDWRALYDEIGKRFPNYGYYTMASPMEANDQATFTADAVDDLADITRELRDVVWRGQTFGRDEAAWQFRFSYEIHWGQHARQLALYLHARTIAAN